MPTPVLDSGFLANSSDGVFAIDSRQTIVLWNEAAATILGYSSEDALGRRCYTILRGRNAADCPGCRRGCNSIRSARKLELPPTEDLLATTKQGKEVWLNVSRVVVPSSRKGLSVMVVMFREVTGQGELVRTLQEVRDAVTALAPKPRACDARDLHGNAGVAGLTRREREVLGYLAAGVSTASIADVLFLSPRTVRNHVSNMLGKLGLHTRLEAVTYAIRNGLV